MAYCRNCGSPVGGQDRFCPKCGAPLPPSGWDAPAQTGAEGKVMGVLSYLGILVLIPLIGGGNNRFVRFHASQGLTLFVLEVILGIVYRGLVWVLPFGFLWRTAVWLYRLANLACVVLGIVGIANVLTGKMKQLPLIGGIQLIR